MKTKSLKARFKRKKIEALIAVLAVLAIAIPLFPFFPTQAAESKSKIQFVSPAWVAQNASDKNLRILDVRTNPMDYFIGHLPNAVNIADNTLRGPDSGLPVQYLTPDKLGQLLSRAGVTDNSLVLVYSDGRDILGATMVAYVLERLGHSNIAVIDGGYAGYKAAQTVTKEFPKYAAGTLTVRDNKSIRVTLDEVKNLIGKAGVTFIDPRPEKLFQGEEKIWTRNGHIPGARNIPWPTFTDAENPHKLKSLDEIKQVLAAKKIDRNSDIIVTCSTGREATLQYVVLKHLLNYPKVRIYEGSWTEYSQTNLPVETGPEQAV
ncbi:sulfurtransferase [Microcoleus vaginatus]|uniref:sulfurtransferase n=1 Tax=Microcoleus vaginatus TaxID=119532 RepID=UPI0032A842ED